ncbi:hypothetical protein A2223_04635 [Candidatus Falkowbacteria bacterium RIFOXYA2_FULL_35_8]|uniref:Uncharacterized protein n=1 Tax=Candidatus Falkowbacteria bacterium RIFOXYC2_FULL_36_12 TaxID=1798002 RepID=A0A1F5SVW8_9BACT|nr:MAG: hypothetical protein A2478_00275 [Candidatus Falkowbacteria bacterium RIFOXYC2_FULL_36_12]OGF34253.1 MAG: hypothetical protein A2223_04635 [Candidatus Falkowbacteria bacterium RIFOXYA2_FULL_35_8]
MLETTQDIFYLVLSIGIGVISILLAILLIYFIAIARRTNRMFKGVSDIFEKIKLVIEAGLGNFGFVGEGIKWIVKSFFERKQANRVSKKKKKN